MAAPTNTALVKKALANPEPSTHACTPGAGVTSERYDAYGSVLPCERIVSVYWLNMGCVARLGPASELSLLCWACSFLRSGPPQDSG